MKTCIAAGFQAFRSCVMFLITFLELKTDEFGEEVIVSVSELKT